MGGWHELSRSRFLVRHEARGRRFRVSMRNKPGGGLALVLLTMRSGYTGGLG